MQNTTPIARVPKDFNPMKIAEVKNPLAEDFTHSFDGTEITIPKGRILQAPENVARLMAEHIARKIVRSKHKSELARKKKQLGENSESYLKLERSAIPMWEKEVADIIKEIMVVKSSLKDTTIMERVNVKEDLPKAPKNA